MSSDIRVFLQYLKGRKIPDTLPSPTKNYRNKYQYVLRVGDQFRNLFPPQDSRLMGLSDPPGGSAYTDLYDRINSELNFERPIELISRYDNSPFSISIEMDDKRGGGKKKSTKKRTPTKKRRRHTKRRKPTKRRRPIKKRR